MLKIIRGLVALAILPLLLAACGNDAQIEKFNADVSRVHGKFKELKSTLKADRLANDLILQQYSVKLINKVKAEAKSDPENSSTYDGIARLAGELRKEGSVEGLAFQSLFKRFQLLKNISSGDRLSDDEVLRSAALELANLDNAVNADVFNDSLVDPINTLADLSGGSLKRLVIPSRAADDESNRFGAGSHLVGNPAYGHWSTGSNGESFWEFYGKYAMLRNVLGGFGGYGYDPYYSRYPLGWRSSFGGWGRSDFYAYRSPSYYSTYGRSYYGSSSDRSGYKSSQSSLVKKGITPVSQKKPAKDFGKLRSARRASVYGGRVSSAKAGSPVKRTSIYSGKTSGAKVGGSSGSSNSSVKRASVYSPTIRRSSSMGRGGK